MTPMQSISILLYKIIIFAFVTCKVQKILFNVENKSFQNIFIFQEKVVTVLVKLQVLKIILKMWSLKHSYLLLKLTDSINQSINNRFLYASFGSNSFNY